MDSSQLENTSSQYTNVISSLIEPSLSEKASISTADTIKNAKAAKTKIGMKYGSLQTFVKADDVASNISSDLFGVDEVHKIVILDLRLLNLDRNDGNILVKKKELVKPSKQDPKKSQEKKYYYSLIPIDHSLSIPDSLEIYTYDLCWMEWDQIQEPFSQKSLDYIEKLDILKDVRMLDNTFKFRKI